MNIETKYKVGDKVWFYIEALNQYAWGEVFFIQIDINYDTKINYTVKNRFYDNDVWKYYDRNDFRQQNTLTYGEEELAPSPEELKVLLNFKHQNKMDEMTELKKKGLDKIREDLFQ